MNKCVVVAADIVRARLFVVEIDADLKVGSRLVEKADLVNVDYTARGDDAPMVKTERNTNRAQGSMQTQGAMRGRHLAEVERRFGHQIAAKTAELLRVERAHQLVLVAGAKMLGVMRKPMVDVVDVGVKFNELPRNYAGLSPTALHQRLAANHLLPAAEKQQV